MVSAEILTSTRHLDSGQKLRLDGPSALKDIIGVVQIKLVGQDEKLRYVIMHHGLLKPPMSSDIRHINLFFQLAHAL